MRRAESRNHFRHAIGLPCALVASINYDRARPLASGPAPVPGRVDGNHVLAWAADCKRDRRWPCRRHGKCKRGTRRGQRQAARPADRLSNCRPARHGHAAAERRRPADRCGGIARKPCQRLRCHAMVHVYRRKSRGTAAWRLRNQGTRQRFVSRFTAPCALRRTALPPRVRRSGVRKSLDLRGTRRWRCPEVGQTRSDQPTGLSRRRNWPAREHARGRPCRIRRLRPVNGRRR